MSRPARRAPRAWSSCRPPPPGRDPAGAGGLRFVRRRRRGHDGRSSVSRNRVAVAAHRVRPGGKRDPRSGGADSATSRSIRSSTIPRHLRTAGGQAACGAARVLANRTAPFSRRKAEGDPPLPNLGTLAFRSRRGVHARAYVNQGVRLSFAFARRSAARVPRRASSIPAARCAGGASADPRTGINVPMMPERPRGARALGRAVAAQGERRRAGARADRTLGTGTPRIEPTVRRWTPRTPAAMASASARFRATRSLRSQRGGVDTALGHWGPAAEDRGAAAAPSSARSEGAEAQSLASGRSISTSAVERRPVRTARFPMRTGSARRCPRGPHRPHARPHLLSRGHVPPVARGQPRRRVDEATSARPPRTRSTGRRTTRTTSIS
jgi:hypothetical protein